MRPPIALCYDAAGDLGLAPELAEGWAAWMCRMWSFGLAGVS